ncbi:MAG: multicopper oxidase family protein [Alphaproteobacteria bacterium]|nr:multicopper oxidase family protein [Alphaproteobacteria bacterium]
MGLTRRGFLSGTGGFTAALAMPGAIAAEGGTPVALVARERSHRLPGCEAPSALWSYGDAWPLELRVKRGRTFVAGLRNELKEHTTIHWHGVRVPHAMDGVPYMTQDPVLPGQSFRYEFAPPDPGTFFFHPHCDTVTQLGRGLAGVLIVEDPRVEGLFDLDRTLVLKDWRVRPDGGFDAFMTDAGAGKAGTFGQLRTVNGGAAPTIEAAPGARVRLRLVNLDPTRIPVLGTRGAAVTIIATDGNACDPFPAADWRLGPAMRADLAFTIPAKPGADVAIEDVWGAKPFLLARVVASAAPVRIAAKPPAMRLPTADLPNPVLRGAERLEFSLATGHVDPALEAWAKESGMSLDSLCLSQKIFWSINKQAWPGMSHDKKVAPLAELKSGRTYVAELFNTTPHTHPMHLHGHTFRVQRASKSKLRPHWADTVLWRRTNAWRSPSWPGSPATGCSTVTLSNTRKPG